MRLRLFHRVYPSEMVSSSIFTRYFLDAVRAGTCAASGERHVFKIQSVLVTCAKQVAASRKGSDKLLLLLSPNTAF
jgi:hypothetical protein